MIIVVRAWVFLGFFSIRVFFHRHWRLTGQQRKGGDYLLFPSTIPTHSRTLRHLLATLQVGWPSHIFNHLACIYQNATRLDLAPYWCDVDFCWLTCWFDCRFLLQQFDTGNLWIQTCIYYHSCITSKLTNQVCLTTQNYRLSFLRWVFI